MNYYLKSLITALLIITAVSYANAAIPSSYVYEQGNTSGSISDGLCYTNYSSNTVGGLVIDPDLDIDCCVLGGFVWISDTCCGDDGASDIVNGTVLAPDGSSKTAVCCGGVVYTDEDESRCACENAYGAWTGGGTGEYACCDNGVLDLGLGSNPFSLNDTFTITQGVCRLGEWFGLGNCQTTSDCYTAARCPKGLSEADEKCCTGTYGQMNIPYFCNAAHICDYSTTNPKYGCEAPMCVECCIDQDCCNDATVRVRTAQGCVADEGYDGGGTLVDTFGGFIYGQSSLYDYSTGNKVLGKLRVNDGIYYPTGSTIGSLLVGLVGGESNVPLKCGSSCSTCEYYCAANYKPSTCRSTYTCPIYASVPCSTDAECGYYEEVYSDPKCVTKSITTSGTNEKQEKWCEGYTAIDYVCEKEYYNCDMQADFSTGTIEQEWVPVLSHWDAPCSGTPKYNTCFACSPYDCWCDYFANPRDSCRNLPGYTCDGTYHGPDGRCDCDDWDLDGNKDYDVACVCGIAPCNNCGGDFNLGSGNCNKGSYACSYEPATCYSCNAGHWCNIGESCNSGQCCHTDYDTVCDTCYATMCANIACGTDTCGSWDACELGRLCHSGQCYAEGDCTPDGEDRTCAATVGDFFNKGCNDGSGDNARFSGHSGFNCVGPKVGTKYCKKNWSFKTCTPAMAFGSVIDKDADCDRSNAFDSFSCKTDGNIVDVETGSTNYCAKGCRVRVKYCRDVVIYSTMDATADAHYTVKDGNWRELPEGEDHALEKGPTYTVVIGTPAHGNAYPIT